MVGTRLSHYLVEEEIGHGGMGVVYKAQDTRLFRSVAIKILPPHLVSDEKNRQRFVQEARAASALNHPNICTVHDIGEADGAHFIVMELVEGKTLREILEERGKLPEQEVIEIGVKVCEALAAAHAKGIVHRDIKPDNIMLTERGLVKVMDFGLAKLITDEMPLGSAGDSSGSFHSTANIRTTFSTLQGTASYMSPEQIRKESVDHRSDIFSLGVVLYELAFGKTPFRGQTQLEVMKSILKTELPIDGKNSVSAETAQALARALTSRRDQRFQDADAFAKSLKTVIEIPVKNKRIWSMVVVGLVALIAIVTMGIFLLQKNLSRSSESEVALLFRNARTVPATSWPGEEDAPSFSPDGNKLAFHSDRAGNMDIWVKDLRTEEITNLTEDNPTKDQFPHWSPDGGMISYDSERHGGGIFVIDLDTKQTIRIANDGNQGRWSTDGEHIVYRGTNRQLFVVSVKEKTPELFIRPEKVGSVQRPAWSADEKWIFFSRGQQGNFRIYAKSTDTEEIFPIVDDEYYNTFPIWHEKSNGIYYRSDRSGIQEVWFQKLALNKISPSGDPIQITNGANVENLDISMDGERLAYSRMEKRGNIQALRVTGTVSRQKGTIRGVTNWNRWSADPDISPDGQNMVFTSPLYDYRDLFMCDLNGENLQILHRSPYTTDSPAWSPGGDKIVYTDGGGSQMEIWVLNLASGDKARLTDNDLPDLLPDWSPDGKWIAFVRKNPSADLWVMNVSGGLPRQLTNYPAEDASPRFSPDGKRIAFVSERTGHPNVWVVPFEGGEPRQISFDKEVGGTGVCWSPDGKFLYYCPMKNGVRNIWKISPDGQYREQLTFFTSPTRHVARMTRLSFYDNELYFSDFERVGDIWIVERQ